MRHQERPYLAISSKTSSIHGFDIAQFQVTSEQAENSGLSGTDLPVATHSMRKTYCGKMTNKGISI